MLERNITATSKYAIIFCTQNQQNQRSLTHKIMIVYNRTSHKPTARFAACTSHKPSIFFSTGTFHIHSPAI